MDKWVGDGVVDVRYAFSGEGDGENGGDGDGDAPLAYGCKYVQDRMWRDRADILELWEKGAKVYVCGSRVVAKAVGEVGREIVREVGRIAAEKGGMIEGKEGEEKGRGDKEEMERKLEEWWDKQRGERFVTDVFG